MLDHLGFPVSDLAASRRFYEQAFAPLGIEVIMDITDDMTGGHGAHLGFGRKGNPFFWISSGGTGAAGLHVALAAADPATVDAFHKAALEAGGTDNGAPGLRPHYHPGYYGAFVLDPDGHNIEAVFHGGAAT